MAESKEERAQREAQAAQRREQEAAREERARAAEEDAAAQRDAQDRARQEAVQQPLSRQVKGPEDALPMIAQALDRLAPRGAVAFDPEAERRDTRQGGLARVGGRLVNAQGHHIVDAKVGKDGKLYGGRLYDPFEGKVIREFKADEENVG